MRVYLDSESSRSTRRSSAPQGSRISRTFAESEIGRTTFKIGLDRLDDSLVRDFLMWTGCRQHELVHAGPQNQKKKIEEYDEESDAYTDIDDSDPYILLHPKECWVCGGVDGRTEAQYKVLCWEDTDLWILHDLMDNGGETISRCRSFYDSTKGHGKEIVPTWFPFVEEKIALLCPISKLLAKAISEGSVDVSGYDTCVEPYFTTKIGMPAVRIPWKKAFWRRPVFRKTIESVEGLEKSDEPLAATTFDNNWANLGEAAGFPDRFQSYVYRWGNLEILDSRSPLLTVRQSLTRSKKTTVNRFGTRAHATGPTTLCIRGTTPTPLGMPCLRMLAWVVALSLLT